MPLLCHQQAIVNQAECIFSYSILSLTCLQHYTSTWTLRTARTSPYYWSQKAQFRSEPPTLSGHQPDANKGGPKGPWFPAIKGKTAHSASPPWLSWYRPTIVSIVKPSRIIRRFCGLRNQITPLLLLLSSSSSFVGSTFHNVPESPKWNDMILLRKLCLVPCLRFFLLPLPFPLLISLNLSFRAGGFIGMGMIIIPRPLSQHESFPIVQLITTYYYYYYLLRS
jgi:hypothetical protein